MVRFKKCPGEASQLPACASQTKAVMCVCVHPGAASSNSTAVVPLGVVKFHQCAAGGKLG